MKIFTVRTYTIIFIYKILHIVCFVLINECLSSFPLTDVFQKYFSKTMFGYYIADNK